MCYVFDESQDFEKKNIYHRFIKIFKYLFLGKYEKQHTLILSLLFFSFLTNSLNEKLIFAKYIYITITLMNIVDVILKITIRPFFNRK